MRTISIAGVRQTLMAKRLLLGFTVALVFSGPALLAQSATISSAPTAVDAARIARLEQQVADAKGSADNAWMLTSAALVLMMTGPGLALFYGAWSARRTCSAP